MAFVAANLVIASGNTSDRIALENQTATSVLTQFTAFNAAFEPVFSALSVNDRTVRNWRTESILIQDQLPAAGTLNPQQRQRVVEVVVRICYATLLALTDSRITLAQHDAVLAAWNATFGAIPV